jgi:GH18 family chitinase
MWLLIFCLQDSAIQYWIQKGAPKDKLNLGIGTYGRSFTLKSASNNGVGASTTGAGQPGPYTQESGYLGYNEVQQFLCHMFYSFYMKTEIFLYIIC